MGLSLGLKQRLGLFDEPDDEVRRRVSGRYRNELMTAGWGGLEGAYKALPVRLGGDRGQVGLDFDVFAFQSLEGFHYTSDPCCTRSDQQIASKARTSKNLA